MHVALLAHRAADPEPSGIGRYYVELVQALAARATARYSLCTTREGRAATWLPQGVARREHPGPRKLVALGWATVGRPLVDGAFGDPDLVHALHPWTATPSRAPLVTSVHDLMPIQHPRWYPRLEGWLYGRGIAHARHHARLVIAHSAHGASELEAEAGIDRSRIRVVHLAVGDEFRVRADTDEVAAACARRGVDPGRYLLAVGQVNDRKNLVVLLRALARLDPAARLPLLVAGRPGPGAGTVEAAVEDLALRGTVRLAGYVPSAELPLLVQGARALVHPSKAEGFGFTPLEAMAAGVPALCSDAGALPEIAGPGAQLVAPDDADAWAAALERVAHDDRWRDELVARGAAHQERFRWDRVAAETEQVHAEALAT